MASAVWESIPDPLAPRSPPRAETRNLLSSFPSLEVGSAGRGALAPERDPLEGVRGLRVSLDKERSAGGAANSSNTANSGDTTEGEHLESLKRSSAASAVPEAAASTLDGERADNRR